MSSFEGTFPFISWEINRKLKIERNPQDNKDCQLPLFRRQSSQQLHLSSSEKSYIKSRFLNLKFSHRFGEKCNGILCQIINFLVQFTALLSFPFSSFPRYQTSFFLTAISFCYTRSSPIHHSLEIPLSLHMVFVCIKTIFHFFCECFSKSVVILVTLLRTITNSLRAASFLKYGSSKQNKRKQRDRNDALIIMRFSEYFVLG